MTTRVAMYFSLFLLAMVPNTLAQGINITAFNAENLFDTIDDPDNPRDDTYLPLVLKNSMQPSHNAACETTNEGSKFYTKQCKELDWSETVYSAKLKRYADVIKTMPQTPDVLVIAETENPKVLNDLVNNHLSGFGYSVVQLDTSDKPKSRGIDVGMLSRLELVGIPSAHKITFAKDQEKCGKTRDILQAAFKLPDGEILNVFGVHFPSGGNPINCRIRAFKQLKTLKESLPSKSLSVAAGDFNINCLETVTEGFNRLLFKGDWYVSPLVKHGCSAPGSSKFTDHLIYNWNTWSFLDMILISNELSVTRPSEKNWFADLGSFGTVVVHPQQWKTDDKDKGYIEPRRFDPVSMTGVSDHWPVSIRLLPRRSN